MRGMVGGFAAIAIGLLVLGACETQSRDVGFGGGEGFRDECRQFTSCGACTPVEGCGWCFDADGRGLCAADPDECLTPAFTWTWNETGCRVSADAAAGVLVTDDAGAAEDGGAPVTPADGGFTPLDGASLAGDAGDAAPSPFAIEAVPE
jgi:hypothetical protein